MCATNGSTVPLWGCPFGSSNVDCYIKRDIVGVSYPGPCGARRHEVRRSVLVVLARSECVSASCSPMGQDVRTTAMRDLNRGYAFEDRVAATRDGKGKTVEVVRPRLGVRAHL